MRENLKKARTEAGLTQKEVARCADITERCYQYYENGDKTPTVDIAIKIARTLGNTVENLFGTN